ncbi:MAG: type II toxin-antitoxin system prevent-host-death family antitoxin [Chloroflexi bacterium]|nr:type II toxin-antitoxin system prevent-host-death family antitoxin [Chloroflexota bacterium]
MTKVTLAKAKSNLDELLARAAAGERIIIQKRDRELAALVSVAELERLEQLSRSPYSSARSLGQQEKLLNQIEAGQLHPAMAAFGLWQDEDELDDLTEQVYANQAPRAQL